ncbi:MAG: NUDIX hydrolase [Clostridiaceae bacterium]|nr:NUDIX hydrolase [Clostridiaceae bacterium]
MIDKPFAGRVFTVEVHAVTLPDGQVSEREIVRHSGGACVLAIDADRRVAMVRQYRKALDRVMLEIPAGKLEPGEDPLDCARRELSEETGLTARCYQKLATLNPSPGYCSETLHLYLATDLTAGKAHLDQGEFLTCEWVPLDELLAMIDLDQIGDAKTLAALLTACRRIDQDPTLIRS